MGNGADEQLNERKSREEARRLGYADLSCPRCKMFTMEPWGMFTFKCDLCDTIIDGDGHVIADPSPTSDTVPANSDEGC